MLWGDIQFPCSFIYLNDCSIPYLFSSNPYYPLFCSHFQLKFLLHKEHWINQNRSPIHILYCICHCYLYWLFPLLYVTNKLFTLLSPSLLFCIRSYFLLTTQKFSFCNCPLLLPAFSYLIDQYYQHTNLLLFFSYIKKSLRTLFLLPATTIFSFSF